MVAATTGISPADLEFGLVIAVVASVLVYRSSERFRLVYGVPPWRWPSWLWTALTFFFLFPTALLFLVARYTTAPRTPPRPPGGYPGHPGQHPGTGGYPGVPGTGHQPGAGGEEPSAAPARPPLAPPASWAPPGAPPVPAPGWQPPLPASDPSGLPLPPILTEGWYVDPTERFFLRYWDGGAWTDRVASGGRQSTDPVRPGDGDAARR